MEPILYKYVPKRLEDFYNDTHTLQFIKTMIGINNLNILLLGSSGVGKTSLLNTIVSEYYKDIDFNKNSLTLLHGGLVIIQSTCLLYNKKSLFSDISQ